VVAKCKKDQDSGRPSKRCVDCVEEDLTRASVTRFGKTSLRDIAEDREQ